MRTATWLLGCAALALASAFGAAAAAPPAGPVRAATTERNQVPECTNVVIRTNQAIKTREPGQTFSAEVAESIENESGHVLVPRGASAELVVVRASGGAVGTPEIELALRSITVNGKRYAVSSDTSQQRGEEGLGKNKRTAEMAGGGALLGTVVGAIAGGGKGAAIGAITGAVGGAAVQVITKGREVRVPAETLLTFRTEAPVRMRG